MKNVLKAIVTTGALTAAVSANAGFILTTGATSAISNINDYKANLSATGADSMSQGVNQSLDISEAGTIQFYFMGIEAGYTNTFEAKGGAISDTRQGNSGWTNIDLGGANFSVGEIMGDFLFTSNNGVDGAVASDAFGIFYDSQDFGLGNTADIGNTVYFAYDDGGANVNDNHDDYIVKAVFTATSVPEPSSLALAALGLAGLGLARFRKKAA